jgi:2-polyprenyl-3-methyl-5-hydroxy-6-metoxy-1,4-benzoquinol methylase
VSSERERSHDFVRSSTDEIDARFSSSGKNARITRELQHGRFLAQHGPGEIWNWESPAGKLRWARRVKMLSSHVKPGMTVLELGCGAGYFTQELARSKANVVAIDISPELLDIAKSYCSEPNVRYEIEDASELSYHDCVFDSVVGSSVLHHLQIEAALREIYRVLKPAGTIYFTEPNMLNPQIAIQKNVPWIKRKLGDSPDETAFLRWRLRRLLERTGYRHIRLDPFDFLHPRTPVSLITCVDQLGRLLERTPAVSEFAGSLYIRAVK